VGKNSCSILSSLRTNVHGIFRRCRRPHTFERSNLIVFIVLCPEDIRH